MMRQALIITSLFLWLPFTSAVLGSGYRGDLADAWSKSSVVVLGHPHIVSLPHNELEATYAMRIVRAFKGATNGATIEFADLYYRSTASLGLESGSSYLVFIQTLADRRHDPNSTWSVHHHSASFPFVGVRVFKIDEAQLPMVESAIAFVNAYNGSLPAKQKEMLMAKLPEENSYVQGFIHREILMAGMTNAIPYFRSKLAQAQDDTEKLNYASLLRNLGENTQSQLLAWLANPSFTQKNELLEELVRLQDRSVMPMVRQFVNAPDELLAVAARSALLRLGDLDARQSLLEMLIKSQNPIVRYNAIHVLHWEYSGTFTEEEKTTIRRLLNDPDEAIARVAGFLVKKWTATGAPSTSPP